MAPTNFERFGQLPALVPNEVITHAIVHDVTLASGRVLALLTLDNALDHSKPTTLGPGTMIGIGRAMAAQAARAAAGEIHALALTGKPYYLVAGADLNGVKGLREESEGRAMAELGHAVYDLLADLGVPTFAFINGVALGGGLEIALAATYRTVSSGANGIGLPEAFIGLVPGWGGVYRLPRLIGPEAAMTVMIENPLNNNRSLNGAAAHALGIADALFEPADFLEQSLAWADAVLGGRVTVERPRAVDPATDPQAAARWDGAAAKARAFVEAKTSNAAPAPARVIDVFEAGKNATQKESAALECAALTSLMGSTAFHNTVYAFLELVQKRSKHPAGAPDRKLARPVTKVGVVGAGLMAAQLALLFATRLKVPVAITDIDQARVDAGLAHISTEIDKQLAKRRLGHDAANRTRALITGSVTKEAFADADFVIEAVFEELAVKKQVFAEVEAVVSAECILATNTSSLSVTAMAADLLHPERVVGFHFFNPVAQMPLLEIVRAPQTNDAVLATAFALGRELRKTCVLVKDSPAFVVNRVLLCLMGEIANAFDDGTDPHVADGALRPLGLPMSPFNLLAMVGIPVAQHVTESLHTAFGERFRVSANQQALIDAGIRGLWAPAPDGGVESPASTLAVLEFGDAPLTGDELLTRTQDALAREIGLMLEEGVVAGPEDIDLCMIMGAGWPMHLGGITPYLDQVGASERVNGGTFHRA